MINTLRFVFILGQFLVLNFGGLALGGWLMDNGPQTAWYADLNKAPWTPPGWVFGFAWTTIMICFSIYLTFLFKSGNTLKLWLLFGIQFVLNVSWNYVFFNRHWMTGGLIIIVLLTLLILYIMITYRRQGLLKSALLAPYLAWLCVATSLNLYIVLNN